MKKNDELEIVIEDLSTAGEGIGHVEGMTFFVKGGIPGDRLRAGITKLKKNYGYARILELLEPSTDRITPQCPAAGRCGGCSIMSMDYPAQLRWKQNMVRERLSRIGGFEASLLDKVLQPIVGQVWVSGEYMPYYFRNKAQYPVQKGIDGKTRIGFYAAHSHRIVETKSCCIGAKVFDEICELVRQNPDVIPYDEESGKGLLRHVLLRRGYRTAEVMVCFIVNSPGSTKDTTQMLSSLRQDLQPMIDSGIITSICVNYNVTRGNVILGNKTETFYGKPYITDAIQDIRFHISAPSFYQVNSMQMERLYSKVLEFAGLTGEEVVWDLYCGIGTISLFLARHARQVYGIEVVPEAVDNARENAVLNNMDNVTFFLGKAEKILPEFYDGTRRLPDEELISLEESAQDVKQSRQNDRALHPDVIVVDPPRKGCDEKCLDTILQMKPNRIVYVSCDAATLARDLRRLCETDYELRAVAPVDQFGHSVHVECVTMLQRRDM